jgi:hypothetical protein
MKDPLIKDIEKWCGKTSSMDDFITILLLLVCLLGFSGFGYLIYLIMQSF